MPDIYFDVDAALSGVPVNIMPLTDDTDFKTRETAVPYNASGMDLVWNFVTSAGVFTQTAVTPTTSGDYDWNHKGDGMYSIEMPASGGASINNDTEGYGWFTGIATGVLPWRGPIIGFRASGLNDLLCDNAYSATRGLSGTALPAAAADAAGGLTISDAGGLDLDAQRSDVAAILVDTGTTLDGRIPSALTADGNMKADALRISGDATAADNLELFFDGTGYNAANSTVGTVTTYTGNTPQTGDAYAIVNSGTHGNAAIKGYVDDIGTAGAGLTAVPWNSSWDAEVQSEVQDAIEVNNLDHLIKIAVDTDFATTVHLNSVIGNLADNGTSATFDRTTDSLEALRDRGDSAWVTATSVTVSDKTGFSLANGSFVTATFGACDLTSTMKASVNTEADAALADYDAPTNAEMVARTMATAAYATAAAQTAAQADLTAILADSNELQADWANGGRLDLLIDAVKAKTDNLPSDPADASDVASSFSTVNSTLSTIASYIDTEVSAIKAKTDNLPASPASVGSEMTLTSAYDFAKGTVAVTESYNSDGSAPTPVQAILGIMQILMEMSISGTTMTVKKLNGSTTAFTLSLNDASSPTSVTRSS